MLGSVSPFSFEEWIEQDLITRDKLSRTNGESYAGEY